GEAEDQIHGNILKANLLGVLDGRLGLLRRVASVHEFEIRRIERLDADAEPIEAERLDAAQVVLGRVLRIDLDRGLADVLHIESRIDALKQTSQIFEGEQ